MPFMTDMESKSPKKDLRARQWLRQLEPFALVTLGGVIAVLGQFSMAFMESDRARFEASLTRRAEAMQFLDTFSGTMAARIYAASDYFHALRTGADEATLQQKEAAFVEARRAGILREGIFIARGADYFGHEFKSTLYKELFVSLSSLDTALMTFAESRSDSDAKLFLEAEATSNLLCGVLLGTAARRMEGAEYKPPRLHD